MKTLLRYAIIVLTIFTFNACGKDETIATIGEEISTELVTTNVTEDNSINKYDTTAITYSGGKGTSSFLVINGNLWATGKNDFGQLGLGDQVDRDEFTDTGITNVKSVIVGSESTYIIKKSGELYATGKNNNGQLGIGNFNLFIDKFTRININNIKNIYAGVAHTLIIKTDGTLWGAGYNAFGQLGLGNTANRNIFVDTGITDVLYAACGQGHSMIVKSDTTLWAAGQNTAGQLGLGTTNDVEVFTNTGVVDVDKVFCGSSHSFILKNNGSVQAAGYNFYGQLGLGDNGAGTDRTSFTTVSISSVEDIKLGGFHSLILKTDGSVWSTGLNASGQLGISSTTDVDVFTDTTETNVNSIESGWQHSLINISDALYVCGENSNGQLGLNDTTDRTSFTTTSKTADAYIKDNYSSFCLNDFVEYNSNIYATIPINENIPNVHNTLIYVSSTNPYRPFDGQNITPAISSSPMTYTVKGLEEFNSFTLAKVLATSVTYTFKDSLGATVKTDTQVIDCKRDTNGTLSLYPTTVVFYADEQMEANSTVEITLSNSSGDVELGDFTLNNSIDAGFTNLSFRHGIKDYNNYTPDAFGQIPEGNKAIVTTFDITLDIYLTNYDYAVSFNESISGKNVTIDASDSNGAVADGENIFQSLTRRVRVTNVSANSIVKDGSLYKMANCKLSVQEIV